MILSATGLSLMEFFGGVCIFLPKAFSFLFWRLPRRIFWEMKRRSDPQGYAAFKKKREWQHFRFSYLLLNTLSLGSVFIRKFERYQVWPPSTMSEMPEDLSYKVPVTAWDRKLGLDKKKGVKRDV